MIKLQFYATVFLGSFLLFLVQPMLTKALLPAFGGSYLVWGASMVFYQGVLLAGYIFSHFIQRKVGVARYARWHWILLLLPFLLCPFHFDRLGINIHSLPLALGVFTMLFTAVSLPFFTISMTSLVLQRWISVDNRSVNPYVLYSASNLGSILALVLYPTLIEPFTDLQQQGNAWWWGYAVLVVLHFLCLPSRKSNEMVQSEPNLPVSKSSAFDKLKWILLSLSACAMLLAVTNVITLDVASIPFLWVLPLLIYLMAFVLSFKHVMWFPDWIRKGLYWVVILAVAMHLMSQFRISPPVAVSISIHLIVLFVVAINCCGFLVKSRPKDSNELTTFYVMIAVGGLFGSLIVSWIVPLISNSLIEYPLALALTFMSIGMVDKNTFDDFRGVWSKWKPVAIDIIISALVVTALPAFAGKWLSPNLLLVVVAIPISLLLRYRAGKAWNMMWLLLSLTLATQWTEQLAIDAKSVTRLRNYYGIYKVYDLNGMRYLQQGTTEHGRQYLAGPNKNIPISYYYPTTPSAGIMLSNKFDFKDIGMIGLGTGALTAYTSTGQSSTIYEIDKDNKAIAENKFSFINYARKNGAKVNYVFGDGRVSLRNQASNTYDLFIVDAFSSGSIPVHLLTTQAIEEYMRVLRDDGILLMHISNKMLELHPVIYSNAKALGLFACEQSNEGNRNPEADLTYWMVLTKDKMQFRKLTGSLGWWTRSSKDLPKPWTDQYSNVLGAMVWKIKLPQCHL